MNRMTILLLAIGSLVGCSRDSDDAPSAKSPLSESVVLLLDNKPSEALTLCDSVLEKKPNSFDAVMLRGEICEALDDYEGAIAAYEQGASLRPQSTQPQRLLARLRISDTETPPTLEAVDTREVSFVSSQEKSFDHSADDSPDGDLATVEFVEDSVGLRAGDDKSYRRPSEEPTQRVVSAQRSVAQPAPQNLFLVRMQNAIAEGQRLDALSKQQLATGEVARLSDEEAPQLEEQPIQVTRFDFGLGMEATPIRFNTASKTGRSSMMTTDVARWQFSSRNVIQRAISPSPRGSVTVRQRHC